jgi:DNA-binding IclR family transcriptional regulator
MVTDPTDADQAPGQKTRGLTERVVAVMEAVIAAGEPVGPRGLARVVDVDRSAVSRILQQLRDLGVLERVEAGYVPGPRLYTMGRVLEALDTLPNAAHPILEALVAEFDETSYVCLLQGDAAVFLYEVQSSNPLRLVVELGRPVPLHAGAAGRAILSGLAEPERKSLLGRGPMPAITTSTICDVDRLLELARTDRDRGYSVSIEERVDGGASIASPFFGSDGRCQGSVVFTSPLTRFESGQIERIGATVHEAAQSLSNRLGRPGPDSA